MATNSTLPGPILIVGTGLLGTSIGLAVREHGVDVLLADTSPAALHLARDLGAGRIPAPTPTSGSSELPGPESSGLPGPAQPALVVIATPPDVAAQAVLAALAAYPQAVVTDVSSVKGPVEREVLAAAAPEAAARYVGSHPMAGKERSGAAAADADLFRGRTWVICAHQDTAASAAAMLRALATEVGAVPYQMTAAEHDDAVAVVSHLPQLMASLTATQLHSIPSEALDLAGQGLRDTTRIAASDPMLWAAILTANAANLLPHVEAARARLGDVVKALQQATQSGTGSPGVMGTLAGVVEDGRAGVARIPGKHGGAARRYAEVIVLVPDKPGQLGTLFGEVGAAGVNIEDFRMEHSAGARLGVATISVLPARAAELAAHLESRGWSVMSA